MSSQTRTALVSSIVFLVIVVPLVVLAAGMELLRRPVGLAYLILWSAWFVLSFWLRPAGVESQANRQGERSMAVMSLLQIAVMVAGAPWEYTHLSGPIPRGGPLAWLGLALMLVGTVLQVVSMRVMRGLYTTRLGIQDGHRLVRSGPYRVVRHPGYSSNLLIFAGMGLALSSLLGLALAVVTALFLHGRMNIEEQMLAAAFGAEYNAYRRETRWRLLPGIY